MPDRAARRDEVLDRLAQRNRVIGYLRIAVPAFGAVVLVALVSQIIIANMVADIGFRGVRISREVVEVDAPAYSGVMANGTQYQVSADTASAPLGGGDVVTLQDAVLDLQRPDGYVVKAEAEQAEFSLSGQTVRVADVLHFVDSRDTRAKLRNTDIDWTEQTLVAHDNVHIVFADGSVLTGASLVYDADRQIWDFKLVKLTVKSEQ